MWCYCGLSEMSSSICVVRVPNLTLSLSRSCLTGSQNHEIESWQSLTFVHYDERFVTVCTLATDCGWGCLRVVYVREIVGGSAKKETIALILFRMIAVGKCQVGSTWVTQLVALNQGETNIPCGTLTHLALLVPLSSRHLVDRGTEWQKKIWSFEQRC